MGNEYFFEYDSQKDTNTIFYMSSIDNEMLERPVQNFMKNLDNNTYMFQEDTILLKSLKERPVKEKGRTAEIKSTYRSAFKSA